MAAGSGRECGEGHGQVSITSAAGDLATSLGVERHLSERLAIGIRNRQLAEDAPIEQLGQAGLVILIL